MSISRRRICFACLGLLLAGPGALVSTASAQGRKRPRRKAPASAKKAGAKKAPARAATRKAAATATAKNAAATAATTNAAAAEAATNAAASAAPAAPPNAAELLKASDRARGGMEDGISWAVKIESIEDDDRQETAYLVKARGVDAHVETTQPARRKGEVMLFNDRTIWYFKPGLQSPIAISARQRLSGQAANGDIATTNYSRDYDAVIVGEEKVNNEDAYRLELKAKSKNVTYDKIQYWISKSRKLALKANYLTLQGKVFKSAEFAYGNPLVAGGKRYDFVSKMKIVDAAFKNNVTTISYGPPKVERHSESLFNINNVAR